MLYYAESSVNSVQIVSSGLGMRLIYFVHVSNCCRYPLVAFFLVCVDVMVCHLRMT